MCEDHPHKDFDLTRNRLHCRMSAQRTQTALYALREHRNRFQTQLHPLALQSFWANISIYLCSSERGKATCFRSSKEKYWKRLPREAVAKAFELNWSRSA